MIRNIFLPHKGDTMASLLELTTNIVSAHVRTSSMSKEDLVAELQEIHSALSTMEKGEALIETSVEVEEQPVVSLRKAFGRKEVFCMICGKGMTTLGRHLRAAHDITPKEYRADSICKCTTQGIPHDFIGCPVA
jgi:predicted transcriptional regulator